MNVARIDEPVEDDLDLDAESESAVSPESQAAANTGEAASDQVDPDASSADDSASEE